MVVMFFGGYVFLVVMFFLQVVGERRRLREVLGQRRPEARRGHICNLLHSQWHKGCTKSTNWKRTKIEERKKCPNSIYS